MALWTGTRADFVKQYGVMIVSGAKAIGMFPSIVMAQAFIEGLGDNAGGPLDLGNNVFNIVADSSWTGATVSANGINWRAYNSYEDSINDYFKFLTSNSRYKDAGVFTSLSPDTQAAALSAAKYAGEGDAQYTTSLISIAASAKDLMKQVGVFNEIDWWDGVVALLLLGLGIFGVKKAGYIKF